MSRQIPPTRGSLLCMCWQGYSGPTQEDLDERLRQSIDSLEGTQKTVVESARDPFDRCNDVDCGHCDCLEDDDE